ncbi:hypothetical protein [Planktothrix sp. FACHB-1365]|uniref:hypothetical protein n=1 Tax=Planktothrix sp. FACHB-1365 TaxID=2692855 RepID=UPI0016850F26|nr:hypothetical protein [Planktothrix sp. FACHB-1365]MBD2482526.1 hypothetical protein [Planktothrix sp. FACHB-1365]
MSNKLQFFREKMAAFEANTDPQKAIARGYYVNQPQKSLADTLANRIALRPASTHLLAGGIGSGKTTQLLVAKDKINEIGDTYAHYIDVSLYTDLTVISSKVLIAIAGSVLAELTKDTKNPNIEINRNFIIKRAFGHREIIDPYDYYQENNEDEIVVERQGIIPVKSKELSDVKTFINAVDQVTEEAKSIYGNLVLLFDGLDRLNDAQTFSQIVTTDVQVISDMGIGVVLVEPLLATYSSYQPTILESINYFYHQPCFDVKNDPENYEFFKNILYSRSSEDFIEEVALKELIQYSGGVLRDLINLTQASIEESYLASNSMRLEVDDVRNAVRSMGKQKLYGISKDDLKYLMIASHSENFIPTTDEQIKLLVTQRILEYQYPEKRYAVHPTILPLLHPSLV